MTLLTVMSLDARHALRSVLPHPGWRRGTLIGLAVLFALLSVMFVLVGQHTEDHTLMLRSAASLLPALLIVALGVVLRGALELDEREARTTLLLLSPLSEGQQLLAPFGTLLLLASLPFLLLLFPFLLAILITQPVPTLFLLLLSLLAIAWAAVLAVALTAFLNLRLGRTVATRTLTTLSPMLMLLPVLLLREFSIQGISQVGWWVALPLLALPVAGMQAMRHYRATLLYTTERLSATEPVWGQVPYARLLRRSRYPWALLGGPLILVALWLSTHDLLILIRAATLFLLVSPVMGASLACLEAERQQPDRLRLAPLGSRVGRDLGQRVLVPVALAVALCLVGIGLWQRDLPWVLRCTGALLPQVFFTHPRWARPVIAGYSSVLAALVLFTPYLTPAS
ncbi:MAG: hypothetical protein AB1511_00125 [Deinococcota bacterium]